MTATLQWNRSEEGYTESRCGRFRVEPVFNSSTRAQGYVLLDGRPNRLAHRFNRERYAGFDTQAEAKRWAQRVADKAHAEKA